MPTVDHELARAKLTRSLRVTGRRSDGYHLLEAEMATLDLADELWFDQAGDGLEVLDEVDWLPAPAGSGAGRHVVTAGADNLVSRALAAAGRRAHVRLHKRIPAAAGLGGGSADAAAVLRWAGRPAFVDVAALGADVGFCLVGGRATVSGIGEVVEPLDFVDFSVVLVTPAISVSTPEVYRAYDEMGGVRGEGGNDLEPAALGVVPRLAWWRDLVASVSGSVSRLAGSGSTWFVECDGARAASLAAELRGAVAEEGERAFVVAARSTPPS